MGETCREFIERIWGSCTEDEMDGLLWGCTAFPCIDVEGLEEQLKKVKEQSGGDYNKAMAIADKETEEAMQHS